MFRTTLTYIFLASVLAWWLVFLYVAPPSSGIDVGLFRDAGSNLALVHRFEAPGLPYAGDVQPRLFAHYTPLSPLTYGLFAAIVHVRPKTGAFFWLLLACVLAAGALLLVQKSGQKPWLVRLAVLFVLLSLPGMFFDTDRPEALGLILFVLTIITGLRQGVWQLLLNSLLVGLTFLAHPFAGILAAIWIAAIRLTEVLEGNLSVARAAAKLLVCGITSGALIFLTALCYRAADPTAISRFLGHAFHQGRGLGQGKATFYPAGTRPEPLSLLAGWIQHYRGAFRFAIFCAESHSEIVCLIFAICTLSVIVWWLSVGRTSATPAVRVTVLTCVVTVGLTLAIFPGEMNYFVLVTGVLAFGCAAIGVAYKTSRLAGLGCLLFAIIGCLHIPLVGWDVINRVESRSSYLLALSQPARLLPFLPSPDAPVVMRGGQYDLFKPEIRNIVPAFYLETGEDLSNVAGLINCYDGMRATASELLPIPPLLDPSQFRLIERAPAHVWISVFGHRLGRTQKGWGCDLYAHEHL